ncbi:carbohydrate transmembrane transporter [Reticulomyxa filosa]|uniref:Carbohydrate transmembrane transporter n=1 Tax=Reticulomyxa filosa TaxID=46433 RepID=X6NRS4_RETFI|nr:carbohydrate transmembrane transporter [Reticulomyxa filosa]|eukprot:ETO28643.1 carbohydrate transmembrane transporter [Reticulomyxa filosa]
MEASDKKKRLITSFAKEEQQAQYFIPPFWICILQICQKYIFFFWKQYYKMKNLPSLFMHIFVLIFKHNVPTRLFPKPLAFLRTGKKKHLIGPMALLVKGLGLFNDAYQLFVMNMVNVVMEDRYGNAYKSRETLVSTSVFIGAVLGQVIIGALADQLGRRLMMILSCSLLIIGGILCTTAVPTDSSESSVSLVWWLIIARLILGFGIGAEYPLAAASASEQSVDKPKERGPNVAMVFSLQGLGNFLAAFSANLLCQLYARNQPYENENLNIIWRTLFFIGTVPCIGSLINIQFKWEQNKKKKKKGIFYFRMKMQESKAFSKGANASQNWHQHLTIQDKYKLIGKFYWKELLGTSVAWFLFDVVFYAQGIFSDSVLSTVSSNGNDSDDLVDVSLKNVFLALDKNKSKNKIPKGALPGYFVAVATINSIGRRRMQIQGFVIMAILFLLIGIIWDTIKKQLVLFVILYALTFFFSNFGPNTTTFVLPVEIFPTQIRGTCHGIAAASGKLGAVVGAAMFNPLKDAYGSNVTFIFCGIVSILGALVTFFLIFDGPEDPQILDDQFFSNVTQVPELHDKIKHKIEYKGGGSEDDKTKLLLADDRAAQLGIETDKMTSITIRGASMITDDEPDQR